MPAVCTAEGIVVVCGAPVHEKPRNTTAAASRLIAADACRVPAPSRSRPLPWNRPSTRWAISEPDAAGAAALGAGAAAADCGECEHRSGCRW